MIEPTSYHILIADDSEVNVFVLSQILQRNKMQVSIAADGIQAVEMALTNNYDVILMDLNMPKLDGKQAAIEILSKKPDSKIVAITASTEEETKEIITGIGISGYIVKPFDPQKLLYSLNKVLAQEA
ncbi:MAG: response regulator [Bacteroidia bacterium]|nr:response regulator [Bacteroidia bacterium]